MPSTRLQLFVRILKDDFYLLVDLSLIEALFSVPLIVVLAFEYVFLIGVEVRFDTVFPIVFYMGLAAIPCFGIKYVGRNACFSIMKKRVHNEGCFISAQVVSSIRSSGIKSLINGLIAGLSAFIAAAGAVYILFVADTFFKWIGIGAIILQFAIVYGAAEYFSASENFYDIKFFGQLKNSFSFSIMTFPITLAYFALTVGLKFVLSLFAPWLAILTVAVFSLVLNGLSVAAATLLAHHQFDLHINAVSYPEYVGKGLLKKQETE